MSIENWKSVVGYEGLYEVSDQGHVRSLPRRVQAHFGIRTSPGKVLKPTLVSGYPQVHLHDGSRSEKFHVHRLVLEAFVGPPPFADAQGRHFPDPTRTNCNLSNLRWGDAKANADDRGQHGNHMRGERNGASKFTDSDIDRLFDLRRNGCTQTQIARWLAMGQTHVSGILLGQRRNQGAR